MPDFSFQFIIFSNPFIFWSGLLFFLFLTLPVNVLLEAGKEYPYPFPAALKTIHFFLRWSFFALLWCLVFELFFLKSPDEQELAATDRQWGQILQEQEYTNFIEALWHDKAEKLPDCTQNLWTWHGRITDLSFFTYKQCVAREFTIMRTGRPPREESIGRLLKEVVQYNTSYMIWNGYIERIDSIIEQNEILKNLAKLSFIQKIKEDIDVDATYIMMEAKEQRERQKRQLEYRIEELKNDSDVFSERKPTFVEEQFSPQIIISPPEDDFAVQPLFPIVPITPDESTVFHLTSPSTNDYTSFPASKQ